MYVFYLDAAPTERLVSQEGSLLYVLAGGSLRERLGHLRYERLNSAPFRRRDGAQGGAEQTKAMRKKPR